MDDGEVGRVVRVVEEEEVNMYLGGDDAHLHSNEDGTEGTCR
jgi:hypothetical protein